jgi:gas vesicle protein
VGSNGRNGKNGYFVKGLIFGCVSGALAGLLFAPKSGKKLRADIKEKGSEAVNDTKEFYVEAQKKAKSVFEDTVDLLSDACVKTKGIFFRS